MIITVSPSNLAQTTSTGPLVERLFCISDLRYPDSIISMPTSPVHSRRAIRAKVWLSRQLSTLFDVKNYATDMEDLMFRMWARKETNFPLSHIKAKKKTEEQRRLQQQRQRQHFRSVGASEVLHRMV